jgi:hypothetical protein
MNVPIQAVGSLDSYKLRARVWPVLLVVLPCTLAAVAWFPEAANWWTAFSGLLIASGIPALVAQLGRDRGVRKEKNLFDRWGGAPTTVLLRHRGGGNRILRSRYHANLGQLVPDVILPTAEEEVADPAMADEIYEACIAYLRGKTRDRKAFPLVFDENCSYGFRRNLWALKPIGIASTSVAIISLGVLIAYHLLESGRVPLLPAVVMIGNLGFLLLWCIWITPGWVKIAADGYAERLLESSDIL